jgi:hypothetical protein
MAKNKRKRSIEQERGLAKRLGGERTPMSGGGAWKGDVSLSDYLVEAKYTDAKSYRITLATWDKICREGRDALKTPAIALELAGTELVVLSFHEFQYLIKKAGELDK